MIRTIGTRFWQHNKEAARPLRKLWRECKVAGAGATKLLHPDRIALNHLRNWSILNSRGMGAGPAVASLNQDLPGALAVEAVTANQRYNPECESQSSGEP